MCGIAGIIKFDNSLAEIADVAKMLHAVRHRGPDGEGIGIWHSATGSQFIPEVDSFPVESGVGRSSDHYAASSVVFGHRRLAILDLSSAGRQPMFSPCGKVFLTYNGEVYNYLELRAELELNYGVKFLTHSDTEVILHAYLVFGVECFRKFNGMFALVIFDARVPGEEKVVTARDPFGIKPLYYSWNGLEFVFCSEVKGILALPRISRKMNAEVVRSFLSSGQSEFASGETFVSAIREFPAASYSVNFLMGDAQLSSIRYWNPSLNTPSIRDMDIGAEQLRRQLEDSVLLHMRSDVPVACAVSGGVDSSGLLSLMNCQRAEGAFIHGFTYVSDCKNKSEEAWADIAVMNRNVIHHKVRCYDKDLSAMMDDVIYTQDFPFSGTSIYAQNKIFQSVAQAGIKVTLDGQGPDELFGGYGDAVHSRLRDLQQAFRFREACQFALGNYRPVRALAHFMYCLIPGARKLNFAWKSYTSPYRKVLRIPNSLRFQRKKPKVLRSMLMDSLLRDGLPSLMRFEDRNSMAHSVESRVPYLTKDIAELSFLMSDELLINASQSKAVLREALKPYLPGAIYQRKDKIGFETPEATWMFSNADWLQFQLANSSDAVSNYINMEQLSNRVKEFIAGKIRYDPIIWRCLCFIAWTRIFDVTD